MKKIIIGGIIVALSACSSQNSIKEDHTKSTEKVMRYDTIQDEYDESILVGEINQKVLTSTDFIDWYDENYEYEVNQEVVNQFKNDLKNYTIDMYMGTWCSDSHREVPRLYKILEEADYPMNQLKVIAVDHDKKGLDGVDLDVQVDYVPLIILKKDGKEQGRIVESPINSLEEDLRDIVKGTPQTPNYAE